MKCTKNRELLNRAYNAGLDNLNDVELLTLVVGESDIAHGIMEKTNGSLKNLARLYPSELSTINGVSESKAMRIAASVELGKRKFMEEERRTVIQSSSDISKYLQVKLSDKETEAFMVIYLNRSNKIIGERTISHGGITGTVADPRVILRHAITIGAVNLILCHNHPSGSLNPSRVDEQLTSKIRDAARLLDMTVLDHVIVSTEGYYSFADEGLL